MQSLFSNFFGATAQDSEGPGTVARNGGQRGAGGRSITFNFPGGGQGRVMFGSFNGQMGPSGSGGDQMGGLDSQVELLDHLR